VGHHSRRTTAAIGIALVIVAVTGQPVLAKPAKGGSAATGYDIGYPQCGGPFPSDPAFGVVGVNDGIVYAANPCLGPELSWAQAAANHAPAFYANTADPGQAYSSHWPVGQTAPQPCTADAPDSTSCSYDYGWNAAKDSFGDAVAAGGGAAAAAAPWWLDVETANSWETLEAAYGPTAAAQENDSQALLGAVAALHDSGVASVGVYSTSYQWGQITGGPATTGTRFAADPSWVAGNGSAAAAQGLCGTTGFTGGPVKLAQYPKRGFDADVACP
jgi:hypothetical protein